jgi:hypothetical protein
MRRSERFAFALVVSASLCSCDTNTDHGYLEIKTEFGTQGSDVYLLNSTELSALKSPAPVDLILEQPVGAIQLDVQRDGRTIKLCSATVMKNRIVTMDISIFNDRLHCTVQ